MPIAPHESHQAAVFAGQGETSKLTTFVRSLAEREGTSPGQVLISCKDDFQQTAAHIAAKAGQIRKSTHRFPCLNDATNNQPQNPLRPCLNS